MYKIGEFVVYGNEGVCKVEDISKINIPGTNKSKDYYTLKPMHENGKVFAPIDTTVFMRPIITSAEVKKIFEEIHFIEQINYDVKNIRVLQEQFKKLLNTHTCLDLLTLIRSINDRKEFLSKNGKKLGQIEEKFLKTAKNQLDDEFSIVLGIPKEKVEDYIETQINSSL